MKNAIRRYSLLTLISSSIFLFISGCSNSNEYEIFGSIHGTVSDHITGDPLENATVIISPGGISKNTDAAGYYKFDNLDTQQYTLTVQKQGYQPNRKTVYSISGEDLQVDIQLSPIP
ncbi:MAG: carboxypeptidase-like regulatory domain-containing protein [Muribaculaceae bacterium]|nr:carboxypeptidase-like regulatory domain-containing protein [Muribaculaceae bacterium]